MLPTTAHLVVEVADTSLSFDLVHKAPRYAAAGVALYWVVDIAAAEVVVHRHPDGDRYRDIQRAGRAASLTVLDVEFAVADFIPE